MRTGKRVAMTYDEMNEMNTQLVTNNHLYPDHASERGEAIKGIVGAIGIDVLKTRDHIDLRDTETVREVVRQYLASCQNTGLLPSKSGLSRALGYSRSGLYAFMQNNANHSTAEFLSIVFDAFSEALDVAAMGGATHPIYTIFTQKAQYGLRDNSPLPEPQKKSPLGPTLSEDELRRRIGQYVVIDDNTAEENEENTGDTP